MILTTFDPILEEKEYVSKFFAQIPNPMSGTEIILYSSASRRKLLITKTPGIKPRDIHKGKYDMQIVVDLNKKTVSFSDEYRSKDAGINFEITVKAVVKVTDADIVWESGIHDVAAALKEEMDAQISEEAAMFDSNEARELNQDLRNAIENLFLVESGISVQGISYTVKLEQKIEKIIKNQSYEKKRSQAAQEISDMYRDNLVAVFAGVADGSMSPELASEKARGSLSNDFNERMRQLQAVTDYMEQLRTKELVDSSHVMKQMEDILKSLPFADYSRQIASDEKKVHGSLEQKNEFKPIDD